MLNKLTLFLLLISIAPFAASQTTSTPSTEPPPAGQTTPQDAPLIDEEKVRVIYHLLRYKDTIDRTLPGLAAEIETLRGLVQQADTGCTNRLEAERKLTAAAQEEARIASESHRICQAALKQATKKRSAGCWFWKIITIGIAGCH
jgi:hypothetical protein